MAFKGIKKNESKQPEDHFSKMEILQIGRPTVDDYKKQKQRVQFYVSQELIDIMSTVFLQNGCKDVNAYAKKLLIEEFEKLKKVN